MSAHAGHAQSRRWFRAGVRVGLVAVAALMLATVFGAPNKPVLARGDAALSAALPATPNPNCTITIPTQPLTAAGLAKPYLLSATDPGAGPCNEANPAQSAFVQAAIINPATGAVSVYAPLVIDQGTSPAKPPIVPTLPAHAVVALWFGFNGNVLVQADTTGGTTRTANHCVDGLPGSPFGQFSYCNAPAFFAAANTAISQGMLTIPALGTAKDGQPCNTVRDFGIVDQDQSDNVQTTYLLLASGLIEQNNAVNAAANPTATVLGNPSDNALVSKILDPLLNCTPWQVNDLSDPGHVAPALPLDELQAAAQQRTPAALVPNGDPMVLMNGTNYDLAKLNLYRAGVDQPTLTDIDNADTARYCREMLRIQPARLTLDQSYMAVASPSPAATTLFNFLVMRFSQAYGLLNCADLLDLPDPSVLQMDGNGVVIGASFNQTVLNQDLNTIAPLQPGDFAADAGAGYSPFF